MHTVNLAEKFIKIGEYWNPRLLEELNDFAAKIVKLKGDFIWHHHDVVDELLLVMKGTLRMRFRDREEVVREGKFLIVPHGVEHQPVADEEVCLLLLEPKGPLNTGNIANERTVRELEHI